MNTLYIFFKLRIHSHLSSITVLWFFFLSDRQRCFTTGIPISQDAYIWIYIFICTYIILCLKLLQIVLNLLHLIIYDNIIYSFTCIFTWNISVFECFLIRFYSNRYTYCSELSYLKPKICIYSMVYIWYL